MTDLNAATPQMRIVKGFVDAFHTRDFKSIQPLIAKNYTFQSFPKTAETEPKVERHAGVMAAMTKLEPNIREVIEAPGKVVIHAAPVCYFGDIKLEYDDLTIYSFIEEDGELKILEVKHFADPQMVSAVHSAAAQAQAQMNLAA